MPSTKILRESDYSNLMEHRLMGVSLRLKRGVVPSNFDWRKHRLRPQRRNKYSDYITVHKAVKKKNSDVITVQKVAVKTIPHNDKNSRSLLKPKIVEKTLNSKSEKTVSSESQVTEDKKSLKTIENNIPVSQQQYQATTPSELKLVEGQTALGNNGVLTYVNQPCQIKPNYPTLNTTGSATYIVLPSNQNNISTNLPELRLVGNELVCNAVQNGGYLSKQGNQRYRDIRPSELNVSGNRLDLGTTRVNGSLPQQWSQNIINTNQNIINTSQNIINTSQNIINTSQNITNTRPSELRMVGNQLIFNTVQNNSLLSPQWNQNVIYTGSSVNKAVTGPLVLSTEQNSGFFLQQGNQNIPNSQPLVFNVVGNQLVLSTEKSSEILSNQHLNVPTFVEIKKEVVEEEEALNEAENSSLALQSSLNSDLPILTNIKEEVMEEEEETLSQAQNSSLALQTSLNRNVPILTNIKEEVMEEEEQEAFNEAEKSSSLPRQCSHSSNDPICTYIKEEVIEVEKEALNEAENSSSLALQSSLSYNVPILTNIREEVREEEKAFNEVENSNSLPRQRSQNSNVPILSKDSLILNATENGEALILQSIEETVPSESVESLRAAENSDPLALLRSQNSEETSSDLEVLSTAENSNSLSLPRSQNNEETSSSELEVLNTAENTDSTVLQVNQSIEKTPPETIKVFSLSIADYNKSLTLHENQCITPNEVIDLEDEQANTTENSGSIVEQQGIEKVQQSDETSVFRIRIQPQILPSGFRNVIIEENHEKMIIRSSIKDMKDVHVWMKQFQDGTFTKWNARDSCPNGKKKVCRKRYVCHQSSHMKIKGPNNSRESKNSECTAKIVIVVKINTPCTRKRDQFVKDGLQGIIKLDLLHNHSLDSAESLRFLPASDSTREKFMRYFNEGMGCKKAKEYHESYLMLRNDYTEKDLACGNINPKIRTVTEWYRKWKLEQGRPEKADELVEEAPRGSRSKTKAEATRTQNVLQALTCETYADGEDNPQVFAVQIKHEQIDSYTLPSSLQKRSKSHRPLRKRARRSLLRPPALITQEIVISEDEN